MSVFDGPSMGNILVSVLGLLGGWLSVASQHRTKRFDEISILELAARNPFRHNLGMLTAFCLATYAFITFCLIGFGYFFLDGVVQADFFWISIEVTSIEWFVVHTLGWSAFFAGAMFYGLQEMDIAYIHYLARAEVLGVPNAPHLPNPQAEDGSAVSDETEAKSEDAEDVPVHLNPLEALQRKVERLEARLKHLEVSEEE